jgi:hypothetical protein
MTIEQLILHHSRQPFKPFRLSLADGRTFEVPHPEVLARPVKVGEKYGRTITVYDDDGLAHWIDLLMVVSIDEIGRNGHATPRRRRR